VPHQRYNHTSPTYQRHTQCNSRHGISQNLFQEPMANQTGNISGNQSTLGPSLGGSIRRQDNQVITKICVLVPRPGCYSHGCVFDIMEELDDTLRKSSLESHLTNITEYNSGTGSSNNCSGSILAQCDLVPNLTTAIIRETVDFSSASGTNNFAKDSTSTNTTKLDAIRVAIIRSKLAAASLSDQAIQDMLHQQLAPTPTNQGYRKSQLRFLAWAQKNNVSFTTFTGADLVNFMADIRNTHYLQVTTLKTIRTAVVHLHDNTASIRSDPLVNSYLDTLYKQAPPISIHRLTPFLVRARSIPSRPSVSLKLLQQKLASLLAMTSFLRPFDLARIPYSTVRPSDGCLAFTVVSPKETRRK
jgi:hypothetical protein